MNLSRLNQLTDKTKDLVLRQIIAILKQRGYKVKEMPKRLLAEPSRELVMELRYVLADQAFTSSQSDFFFVQIGAHDGIGADPIYEFVTRYHWRGLLVEPQAFAFERLVKNYATEPQLLFENVAIDAQEGMRDFYKIRRTPGDNLPAWADRIASFHLDQTLGHKDKIPQIAELIEKVKVRCVPLAVLLERLAIRHVDFFQIDVEGHDWEIIKQIDFDKWEPKIVHYEHSHLSERERDESIDFLVGKGFRITCRGSDTLAYRLS